MPRGPMTEEHKQRIREGRERAARLRTNGEVEPTPKQRREKAPEPERGRFNCDSAGVVIIYEPDLEHGITLDAEAALELRTFLNRVLPSEALIHDVTVGGTGES